MPDDVQHADTPLEHPAVRHEQSDATFRPIALLGLGALSLGIVIFVVIGIFFCGYNTHESSVRQSPYPLAPALSSQLPKEPRLEQLDRLARIDTPDVYKRQQSKDEILNSYGRTDGKGYMHIPIKRAMRLLAAQKLGGSRRQAAARVRSNGLTDSGASNSGRLFRKEEP
jgi:hypothetical protein